ncbi:MAG: peptidylprolyl isomerase, partial [Bacteroidales bacterium]|nr:peptidylprolyl isomerase [Bacteroidales bacterium]
MTKKIIISLISALLFVSAHSQQVVDKIVGVVGNEIIMMSDIENQYIQMVSQQMGVTSNTKCEILEDMLFQKLLYVQAQR